uniref:Lipase/esterase n=1 Tax=uncultured sludge bacterium TaxID=641485 RepID=E0WCK2_9BACT|nr:lipase/esterase [uncultured sludge bacterium]
MQYSWRGFLGLFLVFIGSAIQLRADELPKIEPDVVYGHKDGLALTLDVFRPAGEANRAAVLFMVSGGWYSKWAPPEQAAPLFKPFLQNGYTVMAVRHGSSPRYTIPEAAGDVARAVRFVRQNADRLGVDGDRLGAWGMSAGGHLSLLLGTTGDDGKGDGKEPLDAVASRVQAVVAFVPPTDLRVAVWDAPESLPAYRNFPALNLPLPEAEKFSPLVHVSSDDAPALVIMGGKDELVPPKHGEWIAKAFQEKGVEHKLIVAPEAGHGLEGNHELAFREAVEWFDKHLKKEEE